MTSSPIVRFSESFRLKATARTDVDREPQVAVAPARISRTLRLRERVEPDVDPAAPDREPT